MSRPNTKDASARLARNAASIAKAEHHREPWTEFEDEFLLQFWNPTAASSEIDLMEIAEAIGRTIEACRQRYYLVLRSTSVTYHISSTVRDATRTETTERTVTRKRPAWMDEEGLPSWYV